MYNRPKVVDRSKHKEGKDVLEAYLLAQRLQSMVRLGTATDPQLRGPAFCTVNPSLILVHRSGLESDVCGTRGETGVMPKTWRDRRMRYRDVLKDPNQISYLFFFKIGLI